MKRLLLPIIALSALLLASCQKETEQCNLLHIIHTTDVHGNLFAYDFINDRPGSGSYARVSSYVHDLRADQQYVLLLDAGDFLQGQPTAYYYNFIDTIKPHLFGQLYNFMEYDALTVGNHDIEAGHSVYDRLVGELTMPLLGANVIREESGLPYFQPYVIVKKGGRRIAVIGTTMPGLTHNLPEALWSGMRFEDQIETIQDYMPEILANEPDLIVALIHSGSGPKDSIPRPMSENVGYQLAHAVPELDLILLGHDHRELCDSVVHDSGKTTYLLNPANDAQAISHTTVRFCPNNSGKIWVTPEIVSLSDVTPNSALEHRFKEEFQAVKSFVSKQVGYITESMDARSSFFRPSTFVDLIHQLHFFVYPEAEVSLTAPLDHNAMLDEGFLYVRDLFKLYRYENMLYLMELTGQEIHDTLEESYERWIQTMKSPQDHLIQIDMDEIGGRYLPTKNASFNFDTASGITYTVDVTKDRGERVQITQVGKNAFDPTKTYKVAVNSYRANGGGGLLTRGAGIEQSELKGRVLQATERDLRFYLIDFMQVHNPYQPYLTARWAFVPTEWTEPAIARDSTLMYTPIER